jgi:hypothetical protein
MSSIEAARTAIESLELGEKLVYTHIAAKYGVDRRTLAETPVRRELTQHQDSKPASAQAPAGARVPTLYRAPYKARHTSYTAYDTTLCLRYREKGAWKRLG